MKEHLNGRYKCIACRRVFPYATDLDSHNRLVHANTLSWSLSAPTGKHQKWRIA